MAVPPARDDDTGMTAWTIQVSTVRGGGWLSGVLALVAATALGHPSTAATRHGTQVTRANGFPPCTSRLEAERRGESIVVTVPALPGRNCQSFRPG